MKRTFILLSAALISISATAQTTTNTTNEAKTSTFKNNGFVMSPGVAIGAATIVGSEKDGNTDFGIAYQLQYNFGYMINYNFGFLAGISYTSNATSHKEFVTGGTIKNTYTFNYIDVPIFGRVVTSKPGKVGVVIDGGVNIGMLSKANLKAEGTPTGGGATITESGDIKSYINTTAISIIGFIGIKIPVSPTVNIMTGIDAQRSVNSTFKEPASTNNLTRIGGKVMVAIKLTNN